MKRYMALYLAPASAVRQMMKAATPDQMKAEMEVWAKWMRKNEKAIVDQGAPLGRTKRIAATGVSGTKNQITGYTVVQGKSHDSVAKIFQRHPHLRWKGASIDLIEFFAMPGM